MTTDAERLAWLRLALAPGLDARTAKRLVERAGGAEAAARGRLADLTAVVGHERAPGVSREIREAPADDVRRRAEGLGQRVLVPPDAEWPSARFQGLSDPPRALFVVGRTPPWTVPHVAVVGTRRATGYGLRVTREIAEGVAAAGAWVASGLALGVDAEAHAGALEAAARGGGSTVAVLGCGADVPYPVQNLDLKGRIACDGTLVSEHPPGTPGLKHHFPQRNRIVAALADLTVVTEAPETSGALITARLALDLGRDVAAVPGPVGKPSHVGCHRLVQRGSAHLVTGAADVLALLGLASVEREAPTLPSPPDGPALAVWTALDADEALDADDLCRRTGLSAVDVARAVTWLEIDGRVERVGGLGLRRVR